MSSPLVERWLTVRPPAPPRAAVVLDASESAAPHRDAIYRAAVALLKALPAASEVYFLGNPRPYPAAEFAARWPGWFAENAGRLSLVGPVFRAIEAAGDVSAVVVVGAGRVFDLDDWQGTGPLAATRLVRVGPEPLSGGLLPELTEAREAAGGVEAVVRVDVAGPAVHPIGWDAPATWDAARRRLGVTGGAGGGRGKVTVGLLGPPGAEVHVTAVFASGKEQGVEPGPGVAGAPARWEDLPDARWRPLDAAAQAVFRDASRGNPYRCPVCGGAHPAADFYCPRDAAPGRFASGRRAADRADARRPVYPTPDGCRGEGFVLIHDRGGGRWYHHPLPVLKLPGGGVAVRVGPRAALWGFSSAGWAEGSPLTPYHPAGEGVYALVL